MRRAAVVAAVVVALAAALFLVREPVRPAPNAAPAVAPPTAAPVAPAPAPVSAPASAPGNAPSPTAPAVPAGPVLEGVVVDLATREPVARARVAVRRRGGGAVRGAETDARGRFSIAAEGAVDLQAVAEGYLVGAPVALDAPARDVAVALEPGLVVAGRVVAEGAPLSTATVVALQGAPPGRYLGGFAPARVAADGTFALRGVPPGEGYTVAARAPGFSHSAVPCPPVVPPRGVSGLTIVLARHLIAGKVTGETGHPVAGAWVEAAPAAASEAKAGAPPAARSIDDGRFELVVPVTGRWLVRAAADDRASEWSPVSVGAAGSADVALVLKPVRAIEGRVVDAAKAPVAGVSVVVQLPASHRFSRSTLATDRDGRFKGVFVPGRYSLSARRTGYRRTVKDGVTPGDPPVELALEADPGAVLARASLRSADGTPLAVPELHVDPEDESEAPLAIAVDGEGKAEIGLLGPGAWTVSFPERGPEGELRAWLRLVAVAPGKPLDLTFREERPRGALRGHARGLAGAASIHVTLRPLEPPREAFAFTAARIAAGDGAFAFDAVPPGRYAVIADGEGAAARTEATVEPGGETRVDLWLVRED